MPDLPLPCPVWNQSSQPTSQSKAHNISLPKGYGHKVSLPMQRLILPKSTPVYSASNKGVRKGRSARRFTLCFYFCARCVDDSYGDVDDSISPIIPKESNVLERYLTKHGVWVGQWRLGIPRQRMRMASDIWNAVIVQLLPHTLRTSRLRATRLFIFLPSFVPILSQMFTVDCCWPWRHMCLVALCI